MKSKTLSVKLGHDRFDRMRETESLGSLLEKAISVTFPGVAECGEHYQRKEAAWLARHAIRAVCEEVIRTGRITMPLAVRFAERNEVMTTPRQPSNVIQFESRPA
jgi:hypothetical protein